MKKTIINLSLIFAFLIIYFLQANLFVSFKIVGVMPNLFVILILFIGLYSGRIMGVTYGITLGMLIDLFIGKKIGIAAISLGVIGFLGGEFDKNFSKESRLTIILMVAVSTIIYETISYILSYFIGGNYIQIKAFVKILLIEAFYNILITIILYPLIQNSGYKIENEYKGNKILTRYF